MGPNRYLTGTRYYQLEERYSCLTGITGYD